MRRRLPLGGWRVTERIGTEWCESCQTLCSQGFGRLKKHGKTKWAFAQGEEKMSKLTLDQIIDQIKQRGFLKVSDEIPATRSQLAKGLFNAEANDKEASFFIEKNIGGKKVKRRGWAVMFESNKREKLNMLLDNGMKIRETLEEHFDMEKGELRVAFRRKGQDLWEFLGIFKFIEEDKPNANEQQGMPPNCFTNCYERISDGLILEDWQNGT
ncbi:hypothetical protein R83H12_03010 [Fibrobacteria bacterium R8-3-H12]